eukprot:7138445-Prymnesium_polylepis.2
MAWSIRSVTQMKAMVSLGQGRLHLLAPVVAVERLVPPALELGELRLRPILRLAPFMHLPAVGLEPVGARHLALD